MAPPMIRGFDDKASILDPRSDVIVDACAGSGKTWLLTSRIIRALLLGAKPSEILAITFTRKAAREMSARLTDWLKTLSTSSDEKIRVFLVERGIASSDLDRYVSKARILYREYLATPSGVNINTFHGWFFQIIQFAPWSVQSGRGKELLESEEVILRESWELFFKDQTPSEDINDVLYWLYDNFELHNSHKVINQFVSNRLDWWTYKETFDTSGILSLWRSRQGQDPLNELAHNRVIMGSLPQFKNLLIKNNLPSELKKLNVFEMVSLANDPVAWFSSLKKLLSPERRATGAMRERMGDSSAEEYVHLYREIKDEVGQIDINRTQWIADQLDFAVKIIGDRLIDIFQSIKNSSQVMDFSDLEWMVRSMLLDDDQADFVLHRLDSRYTHLLVDEFQDTNPIQWTILKSWIDASVQAGTPMKLFFVGDPKQSIYRFRRAEPRLFEVAEKLIVDELGGRKVTQNQSYRNSPGITELVNQYFSKENIDFMEQHSVHLSLASEIELFPLVGGVEMPANANQLDGPLWRDPLVCSRSEHTDQPHFKEGLIIGGKILELMRSKGVSDQGKLRNIAYSDILILIKKRTHLKDYEDAFRALGIPFHSQRNGALLDTPEIQDIISLLQFIANPHVDYHLINVLSSPIFSLGDVFLKNFIHRGHQSIWEFLSEGVSHSKFSAHATEAANFMSSWIASSEYLPVHDLLDMIYGDLDLINRYAGQVLPDITERVRSNLSAFLEYTLDFSAGRYPSLTRFLDEVRRLQDLKGKGPGEGLQTDSIDVIRIMTIHGAKGLEAPIVFLADANAKPDSEGWDCLVDWTPGGREPNHFSVYGGKDMRGKARSSLFERHQLLSEEEESNLLYVSITRAKQAFFISGVARGEGRCESWYFRLKDAIDNCRLKSGLNPLSGTNVPHRKTDSDTHLKKNSDTDQSVAPVGVRRSTHKSREIDFGTLVHKMLEIVTAENQEVGKDELRRIVGLDFADFDLAWDVTFKILNSPQLQRFYKPTEFLKAQNEVAYVNIRGDVKRIDRLVHFNEEIWVLDYKISLNESSSLNASKRSQYKQQLTEYKSDLQAMKIIKPIRMGIVLSSGDLIEL